MTGEAVVGVLMSSKIFPIKVEPSCLLKWAWSTIYFQSGSTSSCHRTQKYKIDPNNFGDFHNVSEKIEDRQRMLSGQWPGRGCEYCKNVEDAGGTSDRQYQLSLQTSACQHPPELNDNPTATSVTPTILEVYFTNTCNMACVYCGPHFSSRWEEENRKFKSDLSNDKIDFDVSKSFDNPHYDKMVSDLWKYLEEDQRYRTLRRFHILGGEPFLLKEMDEVINFWDSHGNIDLILMIISNLNIPTKIFKSYIDKFEKLINENKLWKVQITASLDAWGSEQEYTRFGLDLSLWEQNFELIVDKPWVTLGINSALSCLTIKQLPMLIQKINEWNHRRGPMGHTVDRDIGEPIHLSFNTTNNVDDLYIFGPDVFDSDLQAVIDLLPNKTDHDLAITNQFSSILDTLQQSKKDHNKIQNLKKYLSILDHRRKTNWQKTFPWLVDL